MYHAPSGDGAGVLVAIPHDFYVSELSKTHEKLNLPDPGDYATGILFLDKNEALRQESKHLFEATADELGLKVLAWRDLPKDSSCLGQGAKNSEPHLCQVFVKGADSGSLDRDEEGDPMDNDLMERQVYLLRKVMTHKSSNRRRFYVCSLSTKTIVYKGQFNPCQLWQYYQDLKSPDFTTYLCIVHTRFSTNTFPSWERAHPNRYLAHNGEINTLRGNVNLMQAREGVMSSPDFGENLNKVSLESLRSLSGVL